MLARLSHHTRVPVPIWFTPADEQDDGDRGLLPETQFHHRRPGCRRPTPRSPRSRLALRLAHHHALRPRTQFIGPSRPHRGHLRRRRQSLTPKDPHISIRPDVLPPRVIGLPSTRPPSSVATSPASVALVYGHDEPRGRREYRTIALTAAPDIRTETEQPCGSLAFAHHWHGDSRQPLTGVAAVRLVPSTLTMGPSPIRVRRVSVHSATTDEQPGGPSILFDAQATMVNVGVSSRM